MKDRRKLTLILEKYAGEAVAILCARYWYRGIVTEVGEDFVLLTNPFAVERTGAASDPQPAHQDKIPSDLILSVDAMECICQPTWCWHGYGLENERDRVTPDWVFEKWKEDKKKREQGS